MATAKPWYRKAWRAFQKRWVQVCTTLLSGVLVAGAAAAILRPGADADADKSQFKFLHCDQCRMEMVYNQELENRRCPKCQPPKTGYLMPTRNSIKTGTGDSSPWKWVYITCGVVAVATLGGVVYLLYLPVPDPHATFYVCHCPHCAQRMRFRQVSLGGIGMCPRCKRPVRFPDEDEAVLETDLQRQDDEELAAADED